MNKIVLKRELGPFPPRGPSPNEYPRSLSANSISCHCLLYTLAKPSSSISDHEGLNSEEELGDNPVVSDITNHEVLLQLIPRVAMRKRWISFADRAFALSTPPGAHKAWANA